MAKNKKTKSVADGVKELEDVALGGAAAAATIGLGAGLLGGLRA
jgi:hypothetical protein